MKVCQHCGTYGLLFIFPILIICYYLMEFNKLVQIITEVNTE